MAGCGAGPAGPRSNPGRQGLRSSSVAQLLDGGGKTGGVELAHDQEADAEALSEPVRALDDVTLGADEEVGAPSPLLVGEPVEAGGLFGGAASLHDEPE